MREIVVLKKAKEQLEKCEYAIKNNKLKVNLDSFQEPFEEASKKYNALKEKIFFALDELAEEYFVEK